MTPISALASNYVKPKRIDLKNHPSLNEKWVQGLISQDPSILGLGSLKLVEKERQMIGGGRLDFLLADGDDEGFGEERYEVEVQLGATDPSHIIRTIEYWDIEQRRNPSYDHYAVLVAEDITSRFLNVLSLLNRSVQLYAIQMQALEVGDRLTLVFTTVVDLSAQQGDGEDTPPVNRGYWDNKAKALLEIADDIRSLDPQFELRYNQQYIAVAKEGKKYVGLRPMKGGLKLSIYAKESADLADVIGQGGLGGETEYKKRGYRFRLDYEKWKNIADALKNVIKLALNTD